MAGVISSWGGYWNGPIASINQILTGLSGAQILTGEIFAAAHAGDTWRDVNIDVFWNGTIVANLYRPADPNRWAGDFPWITFSLPVIATGNDTLSVNYTAHFAEWSWVAADNLNVQAVVPEPFTLISGLLLLALVLPQVLWRRTKT